MARLPQLPHLGPRARKLVKALAYTVFSITVFLFALQWTFPYDRLADRLEEAASDKGYDLVIGSTERGILPGVVRFKNVKLTTRPKQAELDRVSKIDDPAEREKQLAQLPTMMFIESLEIDLGILAAVRGKASVDLDAKIGPGHITGNITAGSGGTQVALVGRDLPATNLPLREAFSGLPMGGKVRFDLDLDLPNATDKAGRRAPDWSHADGTFEFECPSKCTLGNGEAKFHPKLTNPRNEASVKNGIKFGTINIDSFVARLDIKKGTLEIPKFDLASKDIDLKVEITMNLAQNLDESRVAGCTRYKPSEALAKREGDTFSAIMLIGGPLGPDSMYHVKLDGSFREMKKLALTCGPASGGNMDDPSGKSGGPPKLTIPPPTPSKPTTGGIGSAATVNPPPPPMPINRGVTPDVGSGSGSGSAGSGSAGSAMSPPPVVEGQPPPPPSEAPAPAAEQGSAVQ